MSWLSAKSLEDIAALKASVASGELHPKAAKENLAHEMVARYHSEKDADEAKQGFNAVFAGGGVPGRHAPSTSAPAAKTALPRFFLRPQALLKAVAKPNA